MIRLLPLLLLLAAGCGQKKKSWVDEAPFISSTYEDGTGHKVHLNDTPKRVISLAPSVTEMIYALGAQDKLVAVSQACNYPPEAQTLPEVTTFPDLDLPAIKELNPDLTVSTTELHSEAIYPFFAEAEVPIFMQKFGSLKDVYDNFEKLGVMLGLEAKGKYLADSLRKQDAQLTEATKGQIRYGVMIVVNVKPLIVVGGGSFINEMLEKAGGKNAFGDLEEAYPTITPEAVIKAAPEYIFLPTESEQEYPNLISEYPELYANVPACTANHAFIMDPNIVYRPGPRVFEGMTEFVSILHPRVIGKEDSDASEPQ